MKSAPQNRSFEDCKEEKKYIASQLSMVFNLCREYLEDLDEDPHGMVKEGLILRMGDNSQPPVYGI
jgi:hypothetical protein